MKLNSKAGTGTAKGEAGDEREPLSVRLRIGIGMLRRRCLRRILARTYQGAEEMEE
jgi:hypothetical protein